jgi:hypothetical protein
MEHLVYPEAQLNSVVHFSTNSLFQIDKLTTRDLKLQQNSQNPNDLTRSPMSTDVEGGCSYPILHKQ